MPPVAQRLAPWVGVFGDLLTERLLEMPHEILLSQLSRTFSVNAATHQLSGLNGSGSVVLLPTDALESVTEVARVWQAGGLRNNHALVSWHRTTGDIRPMTFERVPHHFVSKVHRQPITDALSRVALNRQLTIHYRLSGHSYAVYALGRDGNDFTDDDITVARQVQRALIGLDCQITLLRRLNHHPTEIIDAGLTGRELSVLALIASGHSTVAAAHRLQCSPRTVEKHLQRTYRKLGVRDRVNAVRTAQLWGVI